MSSRHHTGVIESLESRTYAASHERVTTVPDDPNPSTTVFAYGDSWRHVGQITFPRISVAVDAGKVIRISGTYGDDSVRVRDVSGGVEVRTFSRQSYTYFYATKYNTRHATAVIENTYRFRADEVKALTFDGADGEDALRNASLRLANVLTTNVESARSERVYREASDGKTPSDPMPMVGHYRPGSSWANTVADQKARADLTKAEIAFFGDSHVSHFLTVGFAYWHKYFRRASNFGIGGDSTRNLLTRINSGLFDVYKPKTLVVSVGTNNFNDPTSGGTDEQVYQGVLKVVSELRARLPDTRLILIGLLPQTGLGQNERILGLNTRLGEAADDNGFSYLDIYSSRFTDGDRFGTALIGTDSHYTGRGYKMLGYYIRDLIEPDPA